MRLLLRFLCVNVVFVCVAYGRALHRLGYAWGICSGVLVDLVTGGD